MGKATFLTALYISVAWTLMVSYQFFTQIAVAAIVSYTETLWPMLGTWLSYRMDMIVFVYAFAWVFVLSSAIPSFILGKERSVLVQFIVCLTLTFVALLIQDILMAYGVGTTDYLLNLALSFNNPLLAAFYLLGPYLLMLAIDLRSRRKVKKKLEENTTTYLEEPTTEPEELKEAYV